MQKSRELKAQIVASSESDAADQQRRWFEAADEYPSVSLRPLSAAQVANRPHQATTTNHQLDLLRAAEPGPASFTGTQSSPPPPPSVLLRPPPSPTVPSTHLSRQPDRSFCTNPSIPRCIRLVCSESERAHTVTMARVYADVNQQMPRAYWDYDSVNISWGVLENYEVVRKIGM